MAKYKLTITNLESGKVEFERACNGIIGAAVSQGAGSSSPTSFSVMSKLLPVDSVSLLMALDHEKDHILASNPVVALGYGMRDKLFSERVRVDITALKKQAGSV